MTTGHTVNKITKCDTVSAEHSAHSILVSHAIANGATDGHVTRVLTTRNVVYRLIKGKSIASQKRMYCLQAKNEKKIKHLALMGYRQR